MFIPYQNSSCCCNLIDTAQVLGHNISFVAEAVDPGVSDLQGVQVVCLGFKLFHCVP